MTFILNVGWLSGVPDLSNWDIKVFFYYKAESINALNPQINAQTLSRHHLQTSCVGFCKFMSSHLYNHCPQPRLQHSLSCKNTAWLMWKHSWWCCFMMDPAAYLSRPTILMPLICLRPLFAWRKPWLLCQFIYFLITPQIKRELASWHAIS